MPGTSEVDQTASNPLGTHERRKKNGHHYAPCLFYTTEVDSQINFL